MIGMKIAMIGQKGMPAGYGGVEAHVHGLAVHLKQAGHDVTVYSRSWYTGFSETKTVEGVVCQYIPTIKTKHLDTITHTLLSTLHAVFQRFDVIHYHGVGPSLVSWIPRLLSPKTNVVTTFHSIDRYHEKWGFLSRLFLRLGEWTACFFAHETITVSQSLGRYCEKEFHKETIYIPNAVSPQSQSRINREPLKKFGLLHEPYMVMISRLIPHKGAHLLIEAFHNLKMNHADDPMIKNLKLAIVGGSVYTDEYIRDLHLQAAPCNDIIFTDFQTGETLDALYRNAIALVHPSLNEGLPITVLKAMALGKPVLVSNIPEHLELLHDPRAIFVQNDVRTMEITLYEFLCLPKEEKESMGNANARLVETSYSWRMILPQIIAVYERQSTRPLAFAAKAI